MQEIKIGFIGCGRHARANLYPSLKLLNVKICGVCAKHLDHASETASRFAIQHAYDNYLEMLEKEKPDAVFVVAEGSVALPIVENCLNHNVHVFTEKPLGLSLPDAQKIADLSKKVGKHVMVGFMKRFAPSYQLLKMYAGDSNSFGKSLSATGTFVFRNFGTEENFVYNAAIHYLDLIRFYFGEVKEIQGYKQLNPDGVNQNFSFITEKGQIGNMFFAGLAPWARHWEEFTITGTKGFVKAENLRRVTHHIAENVVPGVVSWQSLSERDEVYSTVESTTPGGNQPFYLNGFIGEVEHFLDCVKNNREPLTSAADNIKTMELCEKILTQLKAD
jgi:predicted dehydrogenase